MKLVTLIMCCIVLSSCDFSRWSLRNPSGEFSVTLTHGISLEKTSATSVYLVESRTSPLLSERIIGLVLLEDFLICLVERDPLNHVVLELSTGHLKEADSEMLHQMTGKKLEEFNFVDLRSLVEDPRFVKRKGDVYELVVPNPTKKSSSQR